MCIIATKSPLYISCNVLRKPERKVKCEGGVALSAQQQPVRYLVCEFIGPKAAASPISVRCVRSSLLIAFPLSATCIIQNGTRADMPAERSFEQRNSHLYRHRKKSLKHAPRVDGHLHVTLI